MKKYSKTPITFAMFSAGIIISGITSGIANADGVKNNIKFNGQISIGTDGIYRGTTQTEGRAQYVGYLQGEYKNFFAGVRYKSMEDRTTGTDYQMNYVLGYKNKFKDIAYNATASYKQYENLTPKTIDNEFWEYQIDFSKPVTKKLKSKLTLAYSPDGYGKLKEFSYFEGGLDYKLNDKFTLIGTIGYRDASNAADYANYMAGISYGFDKDTTISLRYSDTNREKELGYKYSDSTYLLLLRKF